MCLRGRPAPPRAPRRTARNHSPRRPTCLPQLGRASAGQDYLGGAKGSASLANYAVDSSCLHRNLVFSALSAERHNHGPGLLHRLRRSRGIPREWPSDQGVLIGRDGAGSAVPGAAQRRRVDGHLFAQDRASILDAMNQAVSHLYVYESQQPGATRTKMPSPDLRPWIVALATVGPIEPAALWLDRVDLVGRTGFGPVTSSVRDPR